MMLTPGPVQLQGFRCYTPAVLERDPAHPSPPAQAARATRLRPGLRDLLTLLAPAYLVVFALARSFLEMAVFGRGDRYSYYTALHHLCWYTSLMLAIVLVAHAVLRHPIRRLLWLMYGITLTAVPVVWAAVSGRPLALEYLTGSWREMTLHILTFCLTYERNWPLVAEVVMIFVAMLGLGWWSTRSWRRALLLAVSVHLVMAVIGQAWFSSNPESQALITVPSRLARGQAVQAACWVAIATVLVLTTLWRAGAFSRGSRSWALAAIVAGEAWIAWTLAVLLTGWLPRVFDAVVTGLPVATLALLATRLLRSDRGLVPWTVVVVLAGVTAVQSLVLVPVALHQEHRLLRPRSFEIPNPRRPRRPPPARRDTGIRPTPADRTPARSPGP